MTSSISSLRIRCKSGFLVNLRLYDGLDWTDTPAHKRKTNNFLETRLKDIKFQIDHFMNDGSKKSQEEETQRIAMAIEDIRY